MLENSECAQYEFHKMLMTSAYNIFEYQFCGFCSFIDCYQSFQIICSTLTMPTCLPAAPSPNRALTTAAGTTGHFKMDVAKWRSSFCSSF